MFYSVVLAVLVFLLTAWLHLTALRWISNGMAAVPLTPINRILAVVIVLYAVHFAEIAIYAAAFAAGQHWLALGSFAGEGMETSLDYLYFSSVSYTSLGIGDIFPTGHLRFLTGVEALNGLLLIAWSASFLFSMMNQLWDWRPCAEPVKRGVRSQ